MGSISFCCSPELFKTRASRVRAVGLMLGLAALAVTALLCVLGCGGRGIDGFDQGPAGAAEAGHHSVADDEISRSGCAGLLDYNLDHADRVDQIDHTVDHEQRDQHDAGHASSGEDLGWQWAGHDAGPL